MFVQFLFGGEQFDFHLSSGYLQEEGLPATSRAFIHESPNLKEYAEHTIGDGTIPACVFVSLSSPFFFFSFL